VQRLTVLGQPAMLLGHPGTGLLGRVAAASPAAAAPPAAPVVQRIVKSSSAACGPARRGRSDNLLQTCGYATEISRD
jgi:hypothetical protein